VNVCLGQPVTVINYAAARSPLAAQRYPLKTMGQFYLGDIFRPQPFPQANSNCPRRFSVQRIANSGKRAAA